MYDNLTVEDIIDAYSESYLQQAIREGTEMQRVIELHGRLTILDHQKRPFTVGLPTC